MKQTAIKKKERNERQEIEVDEIDAADNCKKDGKVFEYGALPPPSIQENDAVLLACIADMKNGLHDPKKIRKKYPGTYTRHRQLITELIRDYKRPKEPPLYPLRIWQADLYLKLRQSPNDRTVVFIVDSTGRSGKTWFHRYYRWLHPEKTQMIPNSVFSDMAFMLSVDVSTLFVDVRRGDKNIEYSFLEAVKDGAVDATKYQGHVKIMDRCHVVVFTNHRPSMDELSIDRFDIINIDAGMKLVANIPEPFIETLTETQKIIDMDDAGGSTMQELEILVNREVFDLSQF